jgi:hypothetical protein
MGEDDSTKTRVTPVFDELRRDPAGHTWLGRLLALPEREGASTSRIAAPPIRGSIRYGTDEIEILPAIGLLRWLITNPAQLRPPRPVGKDEETRAKREELLSIEPSRVQAEALALLANGAPRSDWYVLEGPTRPDVYLETFDAIIVIEGKRTEAGATTHTTWLAIRDQMLRHLDGAWELRGDRCVYGFLIVENATGLDVPPHWNGVCDKTVSNKMLADSLPHRSAAERRAIADAFLGATTWQRVCKTFGLKGIVPE